MEFEKMKQTKNLPPGTQQSNRVNKIYMQITLKQEGKWWKLVRYNKKWNLEWEFEFETWFWDINHVYL